ncbi:MAG: hypothetical protein RDU20_20275 [Desulfomonilaceae bacterium]|nr:hypothetical protein [Desulfomonilaceae bacterium]
MKNDKGSAVVIVLLFLGIVSVVGAALMLQSSVDRQFTSAVKSVDSLRDVASTAAGTSFRKLRDVISVPVAPNLDPYVLEPEKYGEGDKDPDGDGWVQGEVSESTFFYRLVFMDKGTTTGATTAGSDLGFGGGGTYGAGTQYEALWNAEGRGRNRGTGDSESRVQIAVRKAHSGH